MENHLAINTHTHAHTQSKSSSAIQPTALVPQPFAQLFVI